MRAVEVMPANVGQEGREITGVEWGSCSIDYGYYTDLRVSAKLNMRGKTPSTWVRLYGNDGSAIGTFIVTGHPAKRKNNEWVSSLTLSSVLHAMAGDYAECECVVKAGTYVSTALKRLFAWVNLEPDLTKMAEYRFAGNLLLERGQSKLSWAYALCNASGNRLDVDPYGHPTVTDRVEISKIQPQAVLSVDDGTLSDLSRDSDDLEIPSRVIVAHQKDDNWIVAYADRSDDLAIQRGYIASQYVELSDLSPETYAGALAEAQKRLRLASVSNIAWNLSTTSELAVGMGVTLRTDDPSFSGDRSCFVKNLSVSMLDKDIQLYDVTLKETSGRDEDE